MFMYLIFGVCCFPSLSTDCPRPVHRPEIEDRAFKAGASAGVISFCPFFQDIKRKGESGQ